MRRILAVLAVAVAGVVSVGGQVAGAPDGSDGAPGAGGTGGQGSRPGQSGEPGRPGQSPGGGGANTGGGTNDGGNNTGGGGNDTGGGTGDNTGTDGGNDAGGTEGGNDGEGTEAPVNPNASLTVGEEAELGEDRHNVTLTAEFVCPDDGRYGLLAKARQNKAISSGATPVQCVEGETRAVTIETTDPNRRFETGEADACVAVVRSGSNALPTPVCRVVTIVAADDAETT